MNGQTVIASFMIRLIQERSNEQSGQTAGWRVVVRQIQSGEETHFATLEEAFAYIREQAGHPGLMAVASD